MRSWRAPAVPAIPPVLHTSAVVNLGSPCFHLLASSLDQSFDGVLHTRAGSAVCCDNPTTVQTLGLRDASRSSQNVLFV